MALLPLLYHDWKDLMHQCQNCRRHQRPNYQRLSSSDGTSCCFNMLRQNNDLDQHKDKLDITRGHGATQHRQRSNTPVLQHDLKDHCQSCGVDLRQMRLSSSDETTGNLNMSRQNCDIDRHKDRLDITRGHGATQHRQRYNTPVPQHVCKDHCQSCGVDLRQMRLSSSDETTGYLNMSRQNCDMDRHKDRLDITIGPGATHHRQRYNDPQMPVPQHVCEDDQVVLDVHHFEPEEIELKIVNNYIVVTAKHEDKRDEHGWVSRQFVRRFQVPENFNIEQLTSKLFNGRLTIVAPKIQLLKNEIEKMIKFPFIDDLRINKEQENPKNIQQSEEKEKPE